MRVLWIGAHPDDEESKVIPWLARGRHVETGYLSLTRGDGAQNLIGNELYEELGVLRTEELLAARRIDGAHQFFGREYDFGFSKTADETLRHWPRDSVLNDIITVVRAFRPHIMITTFSGTPLDGHGQHQVSAILAREAYDLAADSVRYPPEKFGKPWVPLKLYRNVFRTRGTGTISVNVGEYNRHLGLSYSEIGADGRSQHKSQGEGQLRRKGVEWLKLERMDSRVPVPSDPRAEHSIFEGFDTTRILVADSRVAPADSMPAVALDALAARREVALGDSVRVTMGIFNRGTIPIEVWPGGTSAPSLVVLPDSGFKWETWFAGRELTQPWWLTTPRSGDLFSTPVSRISEDERERRQWARVPIRFSGQRGTTEVVSPYVYHYADSAKGDIQLPLIVAPGISVTLEHSTEIARSGVPFDRRMKVTLRSALADSATVSVAISLPAGLAADSAVRTVRMASGAQRVLSFRINGRLPRGAHLLAVSATANGVRYGTGYVPIEYPHITPQRIYRPSSVTINAVDVALPPRTDVAYIRGMGDNVAPFLGQLGIPLTFLDPEDLPATDLARFTAIVVGPRAYQASEALRDNNDYLLAYVKRGGRLVVQYGRSEMLKPGIMPFPIQRKAVPERVTDENAPVKFLDPSASLLNAPNRITSVDFEGWVQERATYMPTTFDARYTPLLEMNDPGEPPNRAAILSARLGRGAYIYVPLALWRQLPAGVPGAARIFANLLGGNEVR